MAYGFINFLFPFLSHLSFIFSFSNSVFTASISTLPYSFFFPLPFCSILFPFMNMSHHRFPLYHHWSLSPIFFFFPFCSLSPLCSISKSPIDVGLVVGLWFPIVIDVGLVVGLWFSIVIDVGVGLWVMGLWIRIVIGVGLWVVGLYSILSHRFAVRCSQSRWFTVLSLKVSSIHCFFKGFINSFSIYCIQVSSLSSLWFSEMVI